MSMSKRCSYVGMTAMFLVVLLIIPAQALAGSPLFSLDTYDDWLAAPIEPVKEDYAAAFEHYTAMGGIDYMYTEPQLYVYEGDPADPPISDAGLVMYWGDPTNDVPQLASWEYTYPQDPNLIGTTLKMTVTPPMGIWAVSLTLNDAAAGWNSWDWWVATPGNPLPLNPGAIPIAPNAPMIITIDPTIVANQSGSNTFAAAGFNPAIATTIQADELAANPGPGGIGWQQFPPVPVVGGQQPWNYWSQVSVTPEPVSSILFVVGGATLGLRRFWKKRKQT